MDYEKKYKEALERARKLHSEYRTIVGVNIPEEIFPELKESEDERIRKGLIKAVSRIFEGNKLFDTDVTREEALAWLEKQGEQHSPIDINKMVNEFAHTKVKGYGIPRMIEVDAYRKGIEDALEKQGEKMTKPKFKVGDKVVINCREEFYTTYNGKEGTIIDIFDLEKNHWGNIVVELDNGMRSAFYASELIEK